MTTMNNEDPADPSVHERQDAYRCIAPACKPLGCSDCNCAVRADVYAALGRSFGDAERERWERALKQTWQAIDPLKPAGQPGSYARGYDNGFAAALQVLRGNLGAQRLS